MGSEASTTPHNSVAHMREAVFFDGVTSNQKLSRFWILLVLSSIIAAAGVIADSTATVIGAMIVAPMLMPIQGVMLATVLGDKINLSRSILLVLTGAGAAIFIGYLLGFFIVNDVVAATNSQVAGRVNPRLIDLLAALGTGIVGSIALVRKDISDTLPGVAIAISLVPPLSVAGLTLESGAYRETFGALLLFGTNVAAILATGIIVMTWYKVQKYVKRAPGDAKPVTGKRAFIIIAAMMLIIGVPLTASTVSSSLDSIHESKIRTVAEQWAQDAGWELLVIKTTLDTVELTVTGSTEAPDIDALRTALRDSGIDPSTVNLEFVPSKTVNLGDNP